LPKKRHFSTVVELQKSIVTMEDKSSKLSTKSVALLEYPLSLSQSKTASRSTERTRCEEYEPNHRSTRIQIHDPPLRFFYRLLGNMESDYLEPLRFQLLFSCWC